MSLRPVDLQVLLPQASEASRNQIVQNQPDPIQQQQHIAQTQKQIDKERQQVLHTEKTEGQKIEQQAKEGGTGSRHEAKEYHPKAEADQEQEKVKEPNKGNLLDIQI